MLTGLLVIQGTADVGKKLTENELERTMEFCKGMFRLCFKV